MTDIASIGVAMQTDGIERGIKSLDVLAAAGPKVEKAMAGVEGAAAKTGKSLKSLGEGSAKGLDEVGRSAPKAADGVGRVAKSADDAKRALAGINTSVASFSQVSSAATQSARGMAGFSTSIQASQKSLIDMQTQMRAASASVAQMGSILTSALPSLQAAAKAQVDAAKSAADMGAAFRSAGDQMKGYGVSVQQATAASKQGSAGAAEAFSLLRTAMVAVASVSVVKQFATMADTMTNIDSRLKLVTSSTNQLAEAQGSLFAIAQSSRIGYADLVGTYAQMARATKELGVSQKDMLGVTQTISQALTISGGSAASAQAALIQLSQGFASGTLRGEELNSVMEQTPRLAQAIAQGLGVSIGELRKMGSEGELTAQKVVAALQKSAPAVAAEFVQMSLTVEQSTTQAGNSVLSLVGTVDKITGASAAAAGGISKFSANVDSLNAQIKTMSATNGLSDFFLAAFNTDKRLNDELAVSKKELAALSARLELAPQNIYLRSATVDAQNLVNKLVEAQARLKALNGAGANAATGGIDVGAFPSRGSQAGYKKEFEAAQQGLLSITAKQDGITKEFTETLGAYAAALKVGAMTEKEYAAAVTEANKKRYEGTEAAKEAAKQAKAGAGAANSANQELEKQASLLAELSGLASSFYKDWDSLNKQYAQGRISLKGLEEAQAALLAKQPAMVALAKEEEEVSKARVKAWEEEVKGWQKQVEERNKAAESAEDALLRAREEERAHALAAAANITLAEAVARLTLARAEDNYQKALSKGSDGETLLALQRETDARRGLVEVMQQKGIREANEKAAEAISKDWEKTSQLIGDTLSDYIMGGGKDAAQYLKRLFATLVLQPVVKYGVDAAMSALGLGGSQGSGGIGGIANLVSTGKSAYSAFTGQNPLLNQIGSFFGIGSSAALNSASNAALSASAESLSAAATNLATGSALDIASAEAIAASAESLTAGAATKTASSMSGMATMWPLAILAGMMVSNKLYGAGYSQKDRNGFGGAISIGNTVETNILGKIVGDKVANILTGAPLMTYVNELLGLSATAHKGAGAIYSGGDIQEGAAIYNQGSFGMGHADEYAASTQAAISSIAANAGMTLDAIAKAFDLKGGYSVSTAFADDRSKDGAWGSLKIADELGKVLVNWEDSRESRWAPKEFANGEEGYKQYLAAVQADVLTAIQAMNLPGWAKDMFAVAEGAEGLQTAIQQVSAIAAVWTGLGRTMSMFADVSGDLQTRLIATSGSMEALAGNAEAFYQGFYTEGERAQKQRELQMGALGDMGLYIDPYQGDAAKEMFRKTVEEAMGSGQAELAAKLLAMSATFAQTADYGQTILDASAKAAKDAADVAIQDAKDKADAAKTAALEAAATAASWTGLAQVLAMFSGITVEMQAGLLAAAGSMEALTSGAQDFNQGFFSGDERMLRQRETQMAALAGMGLYIDPAEGDKAKELFRKTVEEAMASGQAALVAKLQAMSGAFAETADYAQQFLDNMTEAAKQAAEAAAQTAVQNMSGAWSNFGTMAGLAAQYNGNTSGLSQQLGVVQGSYANATTTDGRVAALQQIIGLEQSLWQIQEKERQKAATAQQVAAQAHVDQIKAAAQIEADSARKRIDAAREQLNSANDLLRAAQSLGDYAGKLGYSEASGLSEAERLGLLQSTYSALLGKARGGDVDALDELQGVSSEMLQLKSLLSVSGVENSVFAGRVAAELASASAIQQASATSQIASLDRQIAAAEAAVTLAQETASAAVVSASYAEQQFSVSQDTQKLIDALLAESADSFAKEAAQAQKLVDQGAMTLGALQGLPRELAGAIGASLIPAIAGLASAMSSAAGISVPQFAEGGFHTGGLRIVGERGPELEATGPSRVWNQSQLASALGGNNNAALVAAVDRLTAQNARMSAELAEIKASTSKLAEQFDSVSAGGNALLTEAMA